jgi:hypothetical protein
MKYIWTAICVVIFASALMWGHLEGRHKEPQDNRKDVEIFIEGMLITQEVNYPIKFSRNMGYYDAWHFRLPFICNGEAAELSIKALTEAP